MALQVILKSLELVVVLALIVWNYGDSVLDLESVGVGRVVHQHHLIGRPIDHPQILNIRALRGCKTVLPEQSVMNVFVLGVQVVQYHVGVARVTRCKHDHFKIFRKIPQKLCGVGSDVDARLDDLSGWELDWQFYIIRDACVLVAVDQGLVKVKYDAFLI